MTGTGIQTAEEKKNREGKAENCLKRENICFAEDKKNGDGKRGKYLEKENIWRRKIFGLQRRRIEKEKQ